ncbi:MAG TPA: hypothetical protein VL527_15750 [Dongiaceae bacterium]|jgi:hypothetical protein|nr:hypothetical protein [Dongiaceae bacterium]
MILKLTHPARPPAAFTLVELLVAMGLGVSLLTVVTVLGLYGARSFEGMANYVDLDSKSRNALDILNREVRNATALVSFSTNLPVKSLTLTNSVSAQTIAFTYDSRVGTVVFSKTGQGDRTLLSGCEQWDFSLFNRAPNITSTNISFFPATNSAGQLDPSVCKLINMSWKCVRSIQTHKINTESVETAQIVLRNKVR